MRKEIRLLVVAASMAILLVARAGRAGTSNLPFEDWSAPHVVEFENGSTIIETSVSTGTDDAEESAAGAVNLASTDLELVYDSGSNQTVGMRFANMPVLAAARILSAWVQFRTDEVWSGAVDLLIRGETGDDARSFNTTAYNISTRPRTAAAVAWSPAPWTVVNEAGPNQRTPDLAAVIQEIVDRPGWAPGQALALIITGAGRRTADSFDGGFGPILHIEYRRVEPVNVPPHVDAGPDQVVQFPDPAVLTGAANDDGLPGIPGTLTTRWTLLDGPGEVSFADPRQSATTASFSAAGVYLLRLTADDSSAQPYDDVTVAAIARPLPGLVRDEDAGISPETQGYLGPFVDGNGNLYTVVESDLASRNQPALFKSADGGSTWAEVDAAGRPAGVGDLEGAWMAQEGTTLHLVYQDSAGDVKYATFATSDATLDPDRWAIRETDIVRAAVTVQGCVVVPLSTGEVWAIWHDRGGAGYAKRAGGQWGPVAGISGATAGLSAVRGANDRVHIFYKDPGHRIQHRTLAPDGLLSEPARLDDRGGHPVFKSMTNPVHYDEAGEAVVAIVWADPAGYLRAARVVGDGGPAAEEIIPSGVALTNPGGGNVALVAALAVDPSTRTLHVLWADSLTRNLFASHSTGGGPWSAPVAVEGATRADWIHGANVYRHTAEHAGHLVLGYLIDNNLDGDETTFDIEYREIDPLPVRSDGTTP